MAVPSPLHLLSTETIDNIIIVMQPILNGLTDYAGNTVNPTPIMRSIYNEAVVQNPEVVVSLRYGSIPSFSGGHNILFQDDANGVFQCGYLSRDSRIVLDVVARNDGERKLILDSLISGLSAGYAIDTSGSTGTGGGATGLGGAPYTLEEALIEQLMGQGIAFKGFMEPVWDDFDPKAPRPTGPMMLGVTCIIACDIWITWTIPMWGGFGSIKIGTTIQSMDSEKAINAFNQNNPPGVQFPPVVNPLLTE